MPSSNPFGASTFLSSPEVGGIATIVTVTVPFTAVELSVISSLRKWSAVSTPVWHF